MNLPAVAAGFTALLGLSAGLCAGSAQAATLRVAAPSGGCKPDADKHVYCSLREAVAAANTLPGDDEIVLENNASYELAEVDHDNEGGNGLPAVTGKLRISGNGATIKRSDAAKAPVFRLFRVLQDGDLTLAGVTLRNGATPRGFDGAAIWNVGRLTLESCTLEGNHSGDDGGAIRNDGVLKISDSLVRGNSARWRGGVGGGLQSTTQFGPAEVLIERTTFENNEAWSGGGAVWVMGPTTLINVTLSGNRAGERGGGILNYGSVDLRNVTITANQVGVTGGGLFTYGAVTLGNSLLAGNHAMIAGDCRGTLVSRGYNRIGSSYGCTLEGDATGNLDGDSATLSALSEIGGVRAHMPAKDSTLIDAGNPAQPGSGDAACARVDQRNRAREGRCDIGAIEYDRGG